MTLQTKPSSAAMPGYAASVRQQFADTMLAVGQRDPKLVVIVGDISHGILQPFAAACPGRFFNIGILEPTMMGIAAGVARSGLLPVVHTIAPFLIDRSFEQIKLDFCYHRLHGNIVSVGSAFDYANLGCTHHCYGDIAMLKTLDRMQIVYPGSSVEFDTLFRQAYANEWVTYYRVPAKQHGLDIAPGDIKLGRALRVASGSNLTLISTGPQLRTVMAARERLAAEGWDADVLHIHTIRPLDVEAVRESAARTKAVVVVEEHMRSGGLGDDVLRAIYDVPGLRFASLAIPDHFVTGYGTYEDHCQSCGLTPDGVVEAVRAFGL